MKTRLLLVIALALVFAQISTTLLAQTTALYPVIAVDGNTIATLDSEGNLSVAGRDTPSIPLARLKIAPGASGFGAGVLALSGTTLTVGQPASAEGRGEVTLYELQSGKLTPAATLTGLRIDSEFGRVVALNGTMLAVSAKAADGDAIYIFDKQNGAWKQTYRDYEQDEAITQFGVSLALSREWLFVGTVAAADQPGAAVLYARTIDQWTKAGKITPQASKVGDRFGETVALSGRTAVIGAPGANVAYIFTRGDATWDERAALSATDAKDAPQNVTEFGRVVAVSDTDVFVGGSGAAVLFSRINSPMWKPEAVFAAPADDAQFGATAALGSGYAVIGGDKHFYVYTRAKRWTKPITLTLPLGQ